MRAKRKAEAAAPPAKSRRTGHLRHLLARLMAIWKSAPSNQMEMMKYPSTVTASAKSHESEEEDMMMGYLGFFCVNFFAISLSLSFNQKDKVR